MPLTAERVVERLYDFIARLDIASQGGIDRSESARAFASSHSRSLPLLQF
jgi:hypothetical protein